MILSAQVRICLLDGMNPEDSPCYKTLVEEHGKKYANRWCKVVKVCMKP